MKTSKSPTALARSAWRMQVQDDAQPVAQKAYHIRHFYPYIICVICRNPRRVNQDLTLYIGCPRRSQHEWLSGTASNLPPVDGYGSPARLISHVMQLRHG